MTRDLPWLAALGLGALHGLNPAMGWLFAVALGLHRRSRGVVLLSLVPIALGHAAAVALTLGAFLLFGALVDHTVLAPVAGVVLLGWAAWHFRFGHRRPIRVGMRTGLAGLGLWSFLMAGMHGAGLMLVPIVLPSHLSSAHDAAAAGVSATGASLGLALGILAVHTAAMLGVIATVAIVVYDWTGVAFLRRGWINFDLLWAVALGTAGAVLLAL